MRPPTTSQLAVGVRVGVRVRVCVLLFSELGVLVYLVFPSPGPWGSDLRERRRDIVRESEGGL